MSRLLTTGHQSAATGSTSHRHRQRQPIHRQHIRHTAPPRELTTATNHTGSTSHTLTAGTVADHPTDRQRPRHRLTGWQYVEGIDHRQPIRQADHPTGSPLELWHTIRPTQTTATNPQAQAAHPTPSPLELWHTIPPTDRDQAQAHRWQCVEGTDHGTPSDTETTATGSPLAGYRGN